MAKYDRPESTMVDDAHAITVSALNSVPGFGSAGAELFGYLIEPPLKARKAKWMDEVAEGLRELERRADCVLDELKEKPEFIDTVCQVSMAAIRTSQEEKREALRNAVLNCALPNSPDEWERTMFVHYVESLSVWHLRLLRYFIHPLRWYQENGKQPQQIVMIDNIPAVLVKAFPDLQGKEQLAEQCVADLQQRGLLAKFNYHTNMSGDGIYHPRGTNHGEAFLRFITSPLSKE